LKYSLSNANNSERIYPHKYDLIYCDMIYEDRKLDWINIFWSSLKENGVFIVQTDFHTDYLVRSYFESSEFLYNSPTFVSHLVWKNEWGNHPKNKFHQCFDSIIVYARGNEYKFNTDVIQVPKVTTNKGLNPSGRMTKNATAWIDDICLTTTSKERVKKSDGHLVRWQKPVKLFDRIIAPFTDEGDTILDPFMGVASLGIWCQINNRNYEGVENDKVVFDLAEERMKNYNKNLVLS
jgi:DNA modification methylase